MNWLIIKIPIPTFHITFRDYLVFLAGFNVAVWVFIIAEGLAT